MRIQLWKRVLLTAFACLLAVGVVAWAGSPPGAEKQCRPGVKAAGDASVVLLKPRAAEPVPSASSGAAPESLTGSVVILDPSSPSTCWLPSTSMTFCFQTDSYSPDWEYVYYLWLRFPAGWTVTNAVVSGTPGCDNGSVSGTFSWTAPNSPNEIRISHTRYQGSGGCHCWATYCVTVTTGTGSGNAPVSWYWDGDGYGSTPHFPCSSDNYTPPAQPACDQFVNPPVNLPECAPVMLDTPDDSQEACPGTDVVYPFTVWNNTGAAATFTITSQNNTWPLSYPGTVGPVADGGSANFNVTHTIPAGTAAGSTDSFDIIATSGANSALKGCTTTAAATQPVVLGDPGFEAGTPNPSWNEASTNFGTPLCDVPSCGTGTGTGPHTGDWWAWFGGINAYEVASVSQTVTIPAGGAATLTYWTEFPVCNGMAGDYLDVLIDGNLIQRYTGQDAACNSVGYVQRTNDISAYADGGAHLLEFYSVTATDGYLSNFFLDDISIVAACPTPGPGYDMNFHDQYNRSELCLDSTTGDYVYNVLTGPYAGQSFTGTANIVQYLPTLFLFSTPCPPGSTHCLSGNWNVTRHSASAVLKSFTPVRFSATLFDANYNDSPPCGGGGGGTQ
jgi:hypothetical protein